MSDHTNLLSRHRAGRAALLAGVVLAMSLSPGPAAHAGDELLGDVTDVTGALTDPVVDPALEAVETVVPPAEPLVEPVVEDIVEPTVADVEQAVATVVGEASGDDGGAPPSREDPARGRDERPAGGRGGEPDAGTAEPATAPQTAAQPNTPAAQGGDGDGSVRAGRVDEQETAAADRPSRGSRRSASPCDAASGLPPRGATVAVVRHSGGAPDAEVAGASEGDGGAGDPPGRDRALGLPAEAGPAPALVPPDATRALWLAGLVALVLTLVAGVTVVLARELE